jgi:hypothetical protein
MESYPILPAFLSMLFQMPMRNISLPLISRCQIYGAIGQLHPTKSDAKPGFLFFTPKADFEQQICRERLISDT